MLLAIIGCDILDECPDKACTSLDTNTPTFYIKGKDADAAGRYSGGKFIVLKGSVFSCTEAPSYTGKGKRKQFIEQHCSVASGKIILTEDYTFNTPTAAAEHVLGRSANGWITWKDDTGQTLDTVYPRKSPPRKRKGI